MSRIYVRSSYEVVELGKHLSESDELQFSFDMPRPIVIRLAKTYSDGQKPADSSSAVCEAEAGEEPIDEAMASDINQVFWATSDGEWVSPRGLEPRTWEALDGIYLGLYKTMVSTVSAFRWRYGFTEGPPTPACNRRLYISKDGKLWRGIPVAPTGLHVSVSTINPLPTAAEVRKEVGILVASGMEEPLGWQLFREAWIQRQERPRSALVIGVAAAEVGFKKLVSFLVPQAQWLMDEVQTPSLGKMLHSFLPTLPVKLRFEGKSIRPPKHLLKQLDKAVSFRNKLVHAGQPPPGRNELEEMLRAVSDFLWICDVYAGQGWAHKHISAETLQAWPSEGRPA